jgi:hypothetical protein
MEKIDFKKILKDLYAPRKKIQELDVGEGHFLSVTGKGTPGGAEFDSAVQHLYAAAYTMKFSLLNEGKMNFAVSSLEALYYDDPKKVSMENWRWELLIRVPKEVTPTDLKEAGDAFKKRKGIDISDVDLKTITEGLSLQVLHLGPYENLHATYASLRDYAGEKGWKMGRPCHETYLSDPRRTDPQRLKTLVRIPVV